MILWFCDLHVVLILFPSVPVITEESRRLSCTSNKLFHVRLRFQYLVYSKIVLQRRKDFQPQGVSDQMLVQRDIQSTSSLQWHARAWQECAQRAAALTRAWQVGGGVKLHRFLHELLFMVHWAALNCSLSRQFGAGECSSRSCPCCVQMFFSLTGVLNPCLGIKGLLPFMGLCQDVLPHSLFRKISLQPSGKNSDERLKNFSAAASCFVYLCSSIHWVWIALCGPGSL